MKIITIIGARPQFIKAAPFSETFRKNNTELLVHTGQHYDKNMSEVFFHELGIPEPDYNLGVGSGSHGKQTGKMLELIEEVIIKEKPDGLLVYGDTNSTLAGALAASKLHVPVFHVEAGLRSFDMQMPEEQNRVLTDHISNLLLCPTQTAVNNLKNEGVEKEVFNVGDIMYDTVLRNFDISKKKYCKGKWLDELNKDNSEKFEIEEGEYYLATIHRQENTNNETKLRNIFRALEKLDKPVIMPLHPRTKKLLAEQNIVPKNIKIISPVGYLLMLYLTSNAHMIVTDSGGVQKEAYFCKKPCTTLRDQTEWVETLENEWNVLSSISVDEILAKATREQTCLNYPQPKLFGDGSAAQKICGIIENQVK